MSICTIPRRAARRTLAVWESLKDFGVAAYEPVLQKAFDAIMAASIYPAYFECLDPEEREQFSDFRRDIREALRHLASGRQRAIHDTFSPADIVGHS